MIKQFTAAILLAATSFAASAAEPKFYVGGDVGKFKITEDDVPSATSYGIFAGYNINEIFAIEAGYHRLGKWSGNGADVKINQESLSVLAFLPVAEHVAAFGRVGYNRLDGKVNAEAVGYEDLSGHASRALFGIGVSYEFTKAINGRIEFQRPASQSHNINVGVAYSF
jgi:hypothetical protein